MQKGKFISIGLILALFFVSAFSMNKKDKQRSPKQVAELFLTAFNSKKYEEAGKYSTSETVKLLDMMIGLESMLPDSLKNAPIPISTIIDVQQLDKKCTVTYINNNTPQSKQILNLVEEQNEWLVVMTKEQEEE